MMEAVRNKNTDIKYSLPKSLLQVRNVFQKKANVPLQTYFGSLN